MSDQTTTVSTRSVLLNQPDEIQSAYNAFAVAVKNHTANPNPETLQTMQAAQEEVYRVEDLYREGRKLRLGRALDQREKARRS